MKALSAIVVALGTAMAVLGLVRPSEAATAIDPNNVKLPALLGSIFFDFNHTSGSWEACEGLSYLEGDTVFVPYGMNETGYAQFAALSSYDPNRKCVVAYGYKTTDTSTNVLTFDAETGQLVGSPVWVPVVSFEFPGVGIRMSHDHERKRTIITGPMESYGTSHGFYVVGDGQQESKDLGFTLEQIVPRGLFQLGYLEVLGTKLSAIDPSTGFFWEGVARNSTDTKATEFLLLGVNPDEGRLEHSLVFPIGDCEVLGPLTWHEGSRTILMPTFRTGTREIIVGSFDPSALTCVAMQSLPLALLPYSGFMTFPPGQGNTTATLMVNAASPAAGLQDVGTPNTEAVVLSRGLVSPPLQDAAGLTAAALRRLQQGPPPSKPQMLVNFDLSTGEVVQRTGTVCMSGVAPGVGCPGQLHWAL